MRPNIEVGQHENESLAEGDPPPPCLPHEGYQLWHYAGCAIKHGGHLGVMALNIRAQLRLEGEVNRLKDTIRWLREAGKGCLVEMANDFHPRPRVGMEAAYEDMRLAIENADDVLNETTQ